MKKHLDLTNEVFGNLTVLHEVENAKYKSWFCQCSCGNTKQIVQQRLRDGSTQSCGCIKPNKDKFRAIKSLSSLYKVWSSLKQRCNNPNNQAYSLYGGKGITVCDAWMNYNNFEQWAINNNYNENLSIDRIDGNLGYYPENCRWVTDTVQSRNIKKYKGTSQYLGVHWDNNRNKWSASISINDKKKWLGYFLEEKDAAIFRDTYIKENNLSYFTLNFK